jgi:flagellar assembly protein FliH
MAEGQTMKTTAKFLFDNDFGGTTKPSVSLTDHAAKLAQAEAAAYRSGYAAAEAKAAADAKRDSTAMLARIAASLDELRQGFAALEARLEAEAVDVAVSVARKLAPELIEREPFAEISGLVGECFRHLVGAPHVVVRVNDALYDEAQEKLSGIARARGFDGRLVLLAEPDIALGDCRVEWADGGINRNREAIDAAVGELVARYLAARQGGSATPAQTSVQQGGSKQ